MDTWEKAIGMAVTAAILEEMEEEEKYGWRQYAEDGWEYGLDPEDYETEWEYEAALEEAKNERRGDGWE